MNVKPVVIKEKEYKPAKKFVDFYKVGKNIQNVRMLRVRSDSKSNSPDYYIPKFNSYLEVKVLMDRIDMERSVQVWRIIGNFRRYIETNPLKEKVSGAYLLTPPSFFKYPNDEKNLKDASDCIINAVLESKEDVLLKKGIRVEISKVDEKGSLIAFSTHGGGMVSPERVIHENIGENIVHADKQLQSVPLQGKKGIVLLVNRYVHTNYMNHVYGGLALGFEQLVQLKNVNEIWFEHHEKKSTYELVYEKTFFENLMKGILVDDKNHIRLFQSWISHLSEKKLSFEILLFDCLKYALENKRPDELFDDRFARQRMVELAKFFSEKGEFEKVIWLIDKFKGDSHPSLIPVEGEPDYENEIRNGGSPNAITSVVGQVVWQVKELIHNEKTIAKALVYLEELVRHESLFVKVHCTYALEDMANARVWLTGYGKFPREGECKRFHDLVFYLLDVVKQYPSCFALINRLAHFFGWYRDLTESEALEVLEVLGSTTESVDLFVYYALYRAKHAEQLGDNFDPTQFIQKLKGLITGKDSVSTSFRPALAQYLWRILLNEKSELETIRPYVVMLSEQDYEERLFHGVTDLIEEVDKLEPELGFSLYLKAFDVLYRKFDGVKSAPRARLILPAAFMNQLAFTDPDKYLDLMGKIATLWEKGADFGLFGNLFLPFQKINDEARREAVRAALVEIYLTMLNIHPFVNTPTINQVLKIEGPNDSGRISEILSAIFQPSLVSEIVVPEKIQELDEEFDGDEKFNFIFGKLFGKVTIDTAKSIGRKLFPSEIDFVSSELKGYLRLQNL